MRTACARLRSFASDTFAASATSSSVGTRPSFAVSSFLDPLRLRSSSATWTGTRIVRERFCSRAAPPAGSTRSRTSRTCSPAASRTSRRRGSTQDALLDQVEQRQPLPLVALRDRDDEPQVRVDHALLRVEVAALYPLRQLDLLGRGEQRMAPDLVEEELEAVRGRREVAVRVPGLARAVATQSSAISTPRRSSSPAPRRRRPRDLLCENAVSELRERTPPSSSPARARTSRSSGSSTPASAVLFTSIPVRRGSRDDGSPLVTRAWPATSRTPDTFAVRDTRTSGLTVRHRRGSPPRRPRPDVDAPRRHPAPRQGLAADSLVERVVDGRAWRAEHTMPEAATIARVPAGRASPSSPAREPRRTSARERSRST